MQKYKQIGLFFRVKIFALQLWYFLDTYTLMISLPHELLDCR